MEEQKRRKAEYRSSIRSKLLIRNALVSGKNRLRRSQLRISLSVRTSTGGHFTHTIRIRGRYSIRSGMMRLRKSARPCVLHLLI